MRLSPPITSRSNDRVKALRASFAGHASEPGDLLGIEGENLIAEAIRTVPAFDSVYVREGDQAALSRLDWQAATIKDWVVLARDVFDAALPTRSPQGIAATFPIPDLAHVGRPSALHESSPGISLLGVTLVLVGLQDPGNLGTLLRSAEAFGVARILATADTVNPWNPKAVRASAGSVFRIPVRRGSLHSIRSWLRELGGPIYAAVVSAAGAVPIAEVDLRVPCALMLGNEGAGLARDALALADAAVWIPCATESLNAAIAGSVLMYECMRQNGQRIVPPPSKEYSQPKASEAAEARAAEKAFP